jgi:MFS family permease
MTGGLWCAAFLVPQYLQTVLGRSALQAGLLMLPWTAVTIVITPLAGLLADRVGNRPLIATGLVLQSIGFAWLALTASPTSPYADLVGPFLVAGIGISLVFPAVANAVVGNEPSGELGLASAINTSFREIGGVFGVAVAVATFTAAGSVLSPQLFTDGLVAALVAAASLSMLGAVAALGVSGAAMQPATELATDPTAA